jgi:FKBP-type peptidyl-prolyl cis-trans isomerases 1
MNRRIAIFFLASASAALAQTAAKPATHPTTTRAVATHTASHSAATTTAVKLPPGVPPAQGPIVTAFALRWQDIKIGTGADAEPRKIYKVHYTGWLAADGHKFDSSYDHPGQPIMDKDGNMERDEKGNVKLSGPQPISFPQGMGRVIPGFDQGFTGMKIGGKRRIFIPWQLAYGALGRPGPDAKNPGIPPKADLIFDVELIDQSDITMPANHPMMNPATMGHPAAAPAHPAESAAPQNQAQPQSTAQPEGTTQPAQPETAKPAESTEPK